MSTSSAAQLELEPQEDVAVSGSHSYPGASTLKLQVADRLAAHRALRQRTLSKVSTPRLFTQEEVSPSHPQDVRARRIAAAVAERYAQSQSYRAFLAAEAERARQAARAALEAARQAEAVAAAQQQLLSDLTDWLPEEQTQTAELDSPSVPLAVVEKVPVQAASVTIKLYEENVRRAAVSGVANAVPHELPEEDERQAFEEEIAWRHAPVFEEIMEAAIPTTANLIEFPRQLVAPRKARPRLAEGPLREDAEEADGSTQLRIFEVEADQISTFVATDSDMPALPEWSSIRLSACTVTEPEVAPAYAVSAPTPLSPASYELRVMAAIVDGSLLLAALLSFMTTAAFVAGELPTVQLAAITTAITLGTLFLIYQVLFFTWDIATPGMRYARIGLCTFGDENPTRPAMRRRLGAILLAACPLGLGFLWAWLDEDGLGWHDRISRMYQRSY